MSGTLLAAGAACRFSMGTEGAAMADPARMAMATRVEYCIMIIGSLFVDEYRVNIARVNGHKENQRKIRDAVV